MISFSDANNREKMLNLDKNSLNATLSIQKNLNRQLLTFMKTYMGNVEINMNSNLDSKFFYYINTTVTMLSKSNYNIKQLQDLLITLNTLSENMKTHNYDNSINIEIENYNNQFSEALNSIYENTSSIEKFIHEISIINIPELLKEYSNEIAEEQIIKSDNSTISSDELNSSFIENTLIISDLQGKIILPYTIEKIKNILQNDKHNNYKSISDVIEKLYTKPIKYYKFSAIARFREAYNLMIKKEHTTKFKALCLASELFTNYNLHPAIITACESLDQLDIYLACLEDNTLDEFRFFDIKYEILPVMVTEQ